MEFYTADMIIPMFFDFRANGPNIDFWNESELKAKNESSLIRYQRIMSTLKAFDMKCDMKDFNYTRFPFQMKGYKQLLHQDKVTNNSFIKTEVNRIATKNKMHEIEIREGRIDYESLWMYFFYMANSLDGLRRNYIVASKNFEGNYYLDILHDLFSIDFIKQEDRVFKILGILIDPLERKISKEILIKKYKYPDVDIATIDPEYNTYLRKSRPKYYSNRDWN